MKFTLKLDVDVDVENRTNQSQSEIQKKIMADTMQDQALLKERVRSLAMNYLLYGEDRSYITEETPDDRAPSPR